MYGDEREQDIALEGLKAKAKYVRMGLGKRMSLRMTPEVRFIKDESLERGSRVRLSLSLSLCVCSIRHQFLKHNAAACHFFRFCLYMFCLCRNARAFLVECHAHSRMNCLQK